MAKKWSKAGQTFVRVATHHAKLGNKHDSATNYVDASNCFKKSDPKGIIFLVILSNFITKYMSKKKLVKSNKSISRNFFWIYIHYSYLLFTIKINVYF